MPRALLNAGACDICARCTTFSFDGTGAVISSHAAAQNTFALLSTLPAKRKVSTLLDPM